MRILYFVLIISGAMLVGCGQSNKTTPTPAYNEENLVALSVIEDLILSDISHLTIVECIAKVDEHAQSLWFGEGDQIPADAAIFIDFDDIYMSYEEFDVEVICDKSNLGIYRTLSSFTSPSVGKIWYILNDG